MNIGQGAGPPTEVLSLMNMITPDELEDEEEYEGNIYKKKKKKKKLIKII